MQFYSERPVGVIYEHPQWFNPLFQELEHRRINFHKIDSRYNIFDPAASSVPYKFVYNDMSFSNYLNDKERDLAGRINLLAHFENRGVEVINGAYATAIEHSKAKQLMLLTSLRYPFPATRIVNHIDYVMLAANQLRFPLILKGNFRNTGSLLRIDSREELKEAIANETIKFGADHTLLVQEFIPLKGNHMVRVETINGKFQYALKVYVSGDKLNAWPLEVKLEAFTPSDEIIKAIENIVKTARIDVGSVEYLTDRRNDKTYFIDINAHTNYGIEARNASGHDLYAALVAFFERRMQKIREIELAV
jgi:glutathione synthase/RimK-type ligase-like ATP-grasp enzyme